MTTLANLDPSTLDNVTGGTSPSASTHGSAANTALTTQLSSLSDSVKSLASQPAQNQSVFSNPTTALMFGLALSQRNQAPTVVAGAPSVVYVGRRHWW